MSLRNARAEKRPLSLPILVLGLAATVYSHSYSKAPIRGFGNRSLVGYGVTPGEDRYTMAAETFEVDGEIVEALRISIETGVHRPETAGYEEIVVPFAALETFGGGETEVLVPLAPLSAGEGG